MQKQAIKLNDGKGCEVAFQFLKILKFYYTVFRYRKDVSNVIHCFSNAWQFLYGTAQLVYHYAKDGLLQQISSKESNCDAEISWRTEWLPTPVFMPGEFYEQKSLVGYVTNTCMQRTVALKNIFTGDRFSISSFSRCSPSSFLISGSSFSLTIMQLHFLLSLVGKKAFLHLVHILHSFEKDKFLKV